MSDFWDDTGPGSVSPPGTGGWVRQSGWGSRPDTPEYDPRVLELREPAPAPEERPEPLAEPVARTERHLRVVEPVQRDDTPESARPRPTLIDRVGTLEDFMRSFAAGHLAKRRIDEDLQQRRAAADEQDRRRR